MICKVMAKRFEPNFDILGKEKVDMSLHLVGLT